MSGLAAAGLALGTFTASMSLAQAARASREGRAAKRASAEAMEELEKKNEVIFAEELSIAKQPFKQAREQVLRTGADAIQAIREGDQRGVSGVAQVVGAVDEQGRAIQAGQERQLTDIEKAIIGEKQQQRGVQVGILGEEVAGANLAASQSEQMANQARQQAVASGVQALQSGIQLVAPTFGQSQARQELAASVDTSQLTPQQVEALAGVEGYVPATMADGSVVDATFDPTAIGQMSRSQYRQFERALTPEQQVLLYGKEIPTFLQSIGTGIDLDYLNPFGNQNQLNKQELDRLRALLNQ